MAKKKAQKAPKKKAAEEESSTTEWFVEPVGMAANGIIGRYLAERSEESEFCDMSVLSHQGKRRANLYRVAWSDVKAFEASRANDPELRFNVFNRKTPGSQIVEKTNLIRSAKWSARAS